MSEQPKTVHAKCPYCGQANVVGTLPEERPGEPAAMMEKCSHFVFCGFTKHLGVEYARKEFYVELDGSHSMDAELLRLLDSRFAFVGPIIFAPSKQARKEARAAVADFLRARKFLK